MHLGIQENGFVFCARVEYVVRIFDISLRTLKNLNLSERIRDGYPSGSVGIWLDTIYSCCGGE